MISKKAIVVVVLLLTLLIGGVVRVSAQAIATGSVQGVITDPSNAAIAGATITLNESATSTTRTAVTNDAGRYIFANVPVGSYDITISKTGFRMTKIAKQQVTVGATVNVDAKLELGSSVETIEVTASGANLETANATVGNTISGVALQSLPTLGLDVSTFATLQPGVSPDGNVAGAVLDQSSFMLDGGQNTNDMDGSMNIYTSSFAGDPSGGATSHQSNYYQSMGTGGPTGVMPTPADSIEEFRVSTTNQTADFNSSAGAEVQMVTKRGQNQWHGTAYEYYLDNNWNANTFDNNATATPNPSYHYNRFGGAIGGPVIPKDVLGGKWYIFANYQRFSWPNSTTIERPVPSDAMKAGILQFPDAQGNVQCYNLSNAPQTNPCNPSGPMLAPSQDCAKTAANPTGACDPRGLGVNALVLQMWNKYMPPSNEPADQCGLALCDGLNVLGFKGNMAVPQSDNFGVVRLDHDFGNKWHFMSSYRYYHLVSATTDQIDIGGFFPGDKLGVPSSVSTAPQVPWYLVAALTTNISNNVTNDIHYSFLRNYWSWSRAGDTIQLPGLGGALEPFGESHYSVLAPYNVNTQQTRTRFWDGKDQMIRDDVTWIKGRHTIQFGGTYQHNFNWHERTDNGGGINYQPVYQLGTTSGAGIDMTNFVPAAVGSAKNWGRDYAAMLGIVSVAQIAYTRTGSDLTLNPPLTPAFDKSTIPYYNLYVGDSWHMKPSFTLTYGLGWTLEMPPVEAQGKQIVLVDSNNKPIDLQNYLNAREKAALAGQVYNPQVGFTLVGNSAGHPKYPYNPYYKSFSPRVAAAWNPNFDSGLLGDVFGQNKTVVRGGYSRIYGRLNGVDLVLVPLLGTGLIQPVQCIGALSNGSCGGANPANAFRVGTDGLSAPIPTPSQTLPQPDYPGFNAIAAGAGETLDPNFRPNSSDQFDFTIQRQLNSKVMFEVGYIGRLLHNEYQPVNMNAVPYMMTLGGQRFDQAYAAVMLQYCGGVAGLAGANCAANAAAVTKQPFFEAAMNPTYCAGYASCTAAVVANEGSNFASQSVWNLWSDLDNGGFSFPRSMMNTPIPCSGTGTCYGAAGQMTSGIGVNASIGHGNYNGLFFTVKTSDWHGVTLQTNFTYGKALGTGATVQATSEYTVDDPFDVNRGYGLQPWDRKFVYNMFIVYQTPWYKSQHGVLGRALGGWTFSPVFSAASGLPLQINTTNGASQAFGEGDSLNFFSLESGVLVGANTFGSSRHNNVSGSGGVGTNGYGVNMFGDPLAAWNAVRNPVLGLDNGHNGAAGNIFRGMPFWNLDMSVSKTVNITERVNFQFTTIFTNILNHNQMGDPFLDLSNPAGWGVSPGQVNTPRQIQFGFRISF